MDAYAQDLRHLFHKAYPSSTRGGTDAERIAQTVLSSQFVSGLLSHIKSKVTGHEGSFDELLTRACFKEAKSRELRPNQQSRSISTSKPVSSGQKTGSTSTVALRPTANTCQPPRRDPQSRGNGSRSPSMKCYQCGSPPHLANQCPHRQRATSTETPGREKNQSTSRHVAHISGGSAEQIPSASPQEPTQDTIVDPPQETAAELRVELRRAELGRL